jgi:hypothetical protein
MICERDAEAPQTGPTSPAHGLFLVEVKHWEICSHRLVRRAGRERCFHPVRCRGCEAVMVSVVLASNLAAADCERML